MRLKWMVILGVVLLAVQVSAEETPTLKTQNAKVSYAIGVDWAMNFKSMGVGLDPGHFMLGFKDVLSGEKLIMTEDDLRAAMDAFLKEVKGEEPQAKMGEQPQAKAKRIPENVSYAVGVDAARNLKRQGAELDTDALTKGLRDVFLGEKLLINDREYRELRLAVNVFQAELRQNRIRARMTSAENAQKNRAKNAENNRKEGEVFLAKNKMNESVMTLPSGLQYKILKKGEGRKPTDADTVEVQYRGTLINGTEFGGSKPEQPATFEVHKVIPGWREALRLMPAGSKWQLFVPPGLGYGAQGKGDQIGPDATLIFEIELLAIK